MGATGTLMRVRADGVMPSSCFSRVGCAASLLAIPPVVRDKPPKREWESAVSGLSWKRVLSFLAPTVPQFAQFGSAGLFGPL